MVEMRERVRAFASQGLLAHEIEHRLDYKLTATELELLRSIARREVAGAHRQLPEREPEATPEPVPLDPGTGGPDLPATYERSKTAIARAWGHIDRGRRRTALALALVALAGVALGALLGPALTSRSNKGRSTSAQVGTVGKRESKTTFKSQRSALANGTRRSVESPRRSQPAPRPATVGSRAAHPTAQEPQIAIAGAARLNDRGFQLMNAGRYDAAIPLLRRAVSAAPPRGTDLTYAYALFNLGRSLRLAGKPQEAIPLLERRLRIDNQREAVARELEAARRSGRSTPKAR